MRFAFAFVSLCIASVHAFQAPLPTRSQNMLSRSHLMVSQLSDSTVEEQETVPDTPENSVADVAATSDSAASEEASAPPKKIERERFTVFIGNLDFETTEAEIADLVSQHADVKLLSLPRNRETNQLRGFCFIDVGSEEQIDQVINALSGMKLGERVIDVKRAAKDKPKKGGPRIPDLPEGCSRLYVANLPFESTKEELSELFQKVGEVVQVNMPMNRNNMDVNKGYAFVTMKTEDSAKAIEELNGVELGGRTLQVNESSPPAQKSARKERMPLTKLFVGNLSFYTIEETLIQLFEEFGEVYDCYLPKDQARGGNLSRGFGFVTMSPDAAQNAIRELDGCEIDGRNIQVNEAMAKTPRKFSDNE